MTPEPDKPSLAERIEGIADESEWWLGSENGGRGQLRAIAAELREIAEEIRHPNWMESRVYDKLADRLARREP